MLGRLLEARGAVRAARVGAAHQACRNKAWHTAGGAAAARSAQVRHFGAGGGHGHHGPHVPEFHDKLGKACLVAAFFWIMYRAKENKGQLFGIYRPWEHEHEHEHLHFVEGGDQGDAMPTLEEHEDDDDEEHEDEEH